MPATAARSFHRPRNSAASRHSLGSRYSQRRVPAASPRRDCGRRQLRALIRVKTVSNRSIRTLKVLDPGTRRSILAESVVRWNAKWEETSWV